MQNIRKWEGAPSCKITSPQDRQWLTIDKINDSSKITTAVEAPEDDPVTKAECGYSLDGCLTWKSLTNDSTAPYEFTIDPNAVSTGSNDCWIRARAVNKKGPSLWDVIKVMLFVIKG